jgi:hypothetical protein
VEYNLQHQSGLASRQHRKGGEEYIHEMKELHAHETFEARTTADHPVEEEEVLDEEELERQRRVSLLQPDEPGYVPSKRSSALRSKEIEEGDEMS